MTIDLVQEIKKLEDALENLRELLSEEPAISNRLLCPLCGSSTWRSQYQYICQQDNGACGQIILRTPSRRRKTQDKYDPIFSRTRIQHDKYTIFLANPIYPAMVILIVADKVVDVNYVNGWENGKRGN